MEKDREKENGHRVKSVGFSSLPLSLSPSLLFSLQGANGANFFSPLHCKIRFSSGDPRCASCEAHNREEESVEEAYFTFFAFPLTLLLPGRPLRLG